MQIRRDFATVLPLLSGFASAFSGCVSEGAHGHETTQIGAAMGDDASVTNDAGAPGDGAVASGCVETAPRFSAPMNAAGRGFDLAVDGLEVHAVWSTAACPASAPGAVAAGHVVRHARFGSSGAVDRAQDFPVANGTACAQVGDPVLLLSKAGGTGTQPRVSFLSNRDGAFQAYVLDLSAHSPVPARVGNVSSGASLRDLVGSAVGGKPYVAWIEDSAEGARAVLGGDATTLAAPGAPQTLLGLGLGTIGAGAGREKPLFAFVSNDGTQSSLFVEPLDGSGKPSGAPKLLSQLLAPAAEIAMVALDDGAGLAFTEGQGESAQVRYVGLDQKGELLAAARKLTSGGEVAHGPSIARFAGGLVVAFRVAEDASFDEATLRLAFIDSRGNLAGFRDVLRTSQGGGAVVLRATVDGRLVIGFAEVAADGSQTLQVARVTCYD